MLLLKAAEIWEFIEAKLGRRSGFSRLNILSIKIIRFFGYEKSG